jgi:hypothetical protein
MFLLLSISTYLVELDVFTSAAWCLSNLLLRWFLEFTIAVKYVFTNRIGIMFF